MQCEIQNCHMNEGVDTRNYNINKRKNVIKENHKSGCLKLMCSKQIHLHIKPVFSHFENSLMSMSNGGETLPNSNF